MATKTKELAKELTSTEVSDNGEVEEKSPKQVELESIVAQYNECVQKRDQFLAAAKQQEKFSDKCLGAIELLEKQLSDE